MENIQTTKYNEKCFGKGILDTNLHSGGSLSLTGFLSIAI